MPETLAELVATPRAFLSEDELPPLTLETLPDRELLLDYQVIENHYTINAAHALKEIGIDAAIQITPLAEEEVSGDFVCVRTLGNKALVVLGDVTGHGTIAALLAVSLRELLDAPPFLEFLRGEPPPSEIIRYVEKHVPQHQFGPETLFSMCVAILDREQECVLYSSAGHPYPIICRNAAEPYFLTLARNLGPLIYKDGLSDEPPKRQDLRLSLGPTDTLILHTDGVLDRRIPPSDEVDLRKIGFSDKGTPKPQMVGNILINSPSLLAHELTSARQTLGHINQVVSELCGGAELLDDSTLVVLRMDDRQNNRIQAA